MPSSRRSRRQAASVTSSRQRRKPTSRGCWSRWSEVSTFGPGEPVADDLRSETLTQRVVREHRRAVVPLAVALGINVVVYIAAVYPLSQRVRISNSLTRPPKPRSSRPGGNNGRRGG